MKPQNLVIIMADEHAAKYTGYSGHPIVQTPNLDALAGRGTVFSNAYSTSPICMPARAAFATGKYPHETGYWCNATPYDGRIEGWPHLLEQNGISATSIGKLHYRDASVSHGFGRSIVPMYAVDGIGDIFGAIRDRTPLPVRHGVQQVAKQVGRGESNYTRYDRQILADTLSWLDEVAPTLKQPWVLFISFVCPHFPLIAPDEFHDFYDAASLDLPKACRPEDWPRHPWFEAFRASYITDTFFDDDLRRAATAAYFGLCSFVDSLIGQIVAKVDQSSFAPDTRMIYTSDHGDNLGVRGLWQKSNFYEESAHVPLIVAGQGIAAGAVCETPVSLIDFHPTVLHATGLGDGGPSVNPDGASLLRIAETGDDPERVVFGEYHAAGAANGAFMLRQGRWKYINYANMPEQLFDLQADSEEMTDLSDNPDHAKTLEHFRGLLRARLDPEAVDAQAKAVHLAIVNRHGGAENIMSRGSMGASPPPGTQAASVSTG